MCMCIMINGKRWHRFKGGKYGYMRVFGGMKWKGETM